jgi:hypothetical protein
MCFIVEDVRVVQLGSISFHYFHLLSLQEQNCLDIFHVGLLLAIRPPSMTFDVDASTWQ